MATNEQLQKCKATLLERQNKLIHQIEANFGLSILATEAASELSSYDNHPGDMGTALFERGKDTALNEHAEKELGKINESLHAIDEGTYGICTTCGNDIPYERLEAVLTTDKCMEHADHKAFSRERPIEEEVLNPNINPRSRASEEQVGYDAEDAWQEVSRYGSSDTPSDLFGDRDNYSEMYPNSDENIGEVENIEGCLTADIKGNYTGYSTHHLKNEKE